MTSNISPLRTQRCYRLLQMLLRCGLLWLTLRKQRSQLSRVAWQEEGIHHVGDGDKQFGNDKIVLAQSCSSLTNIRKLFGVEHICFVNAGLGYLNPTWTQGDVGFAQPESHLGKVWSPRLIVFWVSLCKEPCPGRVITRALGELKEGDAEGRSERGHPMHTASVTHCCGSGQPQVQSSMGELESEC